MINNQRIRNIIVLICVAFVLVIVFQVSWLRNSYQITREQVTLTIRTSLEEAIIEKKKEAGDSVRQIIKLLLRNPDDYVYRLDDGTEKFYAGFRQGTKHSSYVAFPINVGDTARAGNDPFAFLLEKINEAELDVLRPIYYTLISSVEYPDSSTERAQSRRVSHLLDYAEDTVSLKRILASILSKKGFIFNGSVQYFSNIDDVYNNAVKMTNPVKSNLQGGIISVVLGGFGRKTITARLDSLSNFIEQKNKGRDQLVMAKPILDDINSVITYHIPAVVIKTGLPFFALIKKMMISIVGSLLVMFVICFCVVYLFIQLLKQKKLTDIKNDFISNISHELKTPIATALAAVQGMRYFDVLKDTDKTKQYLGTAENEMKRLDNMISHILHVSVYENGTFQLSLHHFNLKEMLEEISSAQNSRADHKTVIHLSYSGDEMIDGDQFQLGCVFNNIIDNSVKYAGAEPLIDIECTRQDDYMQIRISDNGPGIPGQYAARVFDKFFRVPDTDNALVKGYGLGLHYVKNLIELHKGNIELAQGSNRGCTFIILLPVAQ